MSKKLDAEDMPLCSYIAESLREEALSMEVNREFGYGFTAERYEEGKPYFDLGFDGEMQGGTYRVNITRIG